MTGFGAAGAGASIRSMCQAPAYPDSRERLKRVAYGKDVDSECSQSSLILVLDRVETRMKKNRYLTSRKRTKGNPGAGRT
jgi:hypothetical protein